MSIEPSFSLDELLAFLGSSEAAASEGYHTQIEWACKLGICQSRVRRLMLAARAQGKLQVTWEHRTALDGRTARVPVYRFEVG